MNMHQCEYCERSFKQKDHLSNHVNWTHRKTTKLSDDELKKSRERAKSQADKRYGPKIKETIPCPKCGIRFEREFRNSDLGRRKARKFCSRKCANSRDWKNHPRKDEIKRSRQRGLERAKVSRKVIKPEIRAKKLFEKQCQWCNLKFRSPKPKTRFCSLSCAAQNRWSNHTPATKPPKSCEWCKEEFVSSQEKTRFCSRSCSSRWINSQSHVKEAIREATTARDFTQSFGRRCYFQERGYSIRCDSILEYSCLQYLFENFDIDHIDRCFKQILYVDSQGVERTFNPDFEAKLRSGSTLIIECKSIQSGKNDIWQSYHANAKVKKEALKKYCVQNQKFDYFWYTQKLPGESRRYRTLLREIS